MAGPIAAQIERVREEMESRPAGLIRHVERVVVEACRLAEQWCVDGERAELAARGHDLFRAHSEEEQLRLAVECGVPIESADRAAPVFLHGPIAAVVLRERLGVADEEVLEAVRDHTTGLAEMPMLSKIILLADKFEPRKRKKRPALSSIRKLARRDLDLALLCWADWNLVRDREREWVTHPRHWEARQRWVAEHHGDLGSAGSSAIRTRGSLAD